MAVTLYTGSEEHEHIGETQFSGGDVEREGATKSKRISNVKDSISMHL